MNHPRTSPIALSLAVLCCGACSATPEPVAPTPAPPVAPVTPVTPVAPPVDVPCPTGEACLAAARASDADRAKAITLAQRACDLGESRGCVLAGDLFVKSDRVREATDAYAKACAAQDGAPARSKGLVCGAAARGAYQQKDFARALTVGTLGCDGDATGGCDVLGVMYGNGEGVPKDGGKAASFFAKGCAAGDREACGHQQAMAAMNDPLAVDGANLKMGTINVEGFAMKDMACKVDGGGLQMLVAGPVLAAVIGKKKAALNACAPGGADVSVRWTSAGKRVTDVRASAGDDKKIEACVVRAVSSSVATFEATCRASFHIGK